jgi:hypothetical protein
VTIRITGSLTRTTGKPYPGKITLISPVKKRLQSVFVQGIAGDIQKCDVKIFLKKFRRYFRDAIVAYVDFDKTMMLTYFWRNEFNSIIFQKYSDSCSVGPVESSLVDNFYAVAT